MENSPTISAIAAIGAHTRVLGTKNQLLWWIPEDLKRAKELTMGHPIVMGRKTHESLGRPLPGRTNIVITSQQEYQSPGCVIVSNFEQALKEARKVETQEIFIFGGAQIYEQALPYVTKLYLTLIEDDSSGDVYFPNYSNFKEIERYGPFDHKGISYYFTTFIRA